MAPSAESPLGNDNVCVGELERGLAFHTNVNPITMTYSFNRAAQIVS